MAKNKLFLTLYTRKGCCLCESLEKKLMSLPLKEINPLLELQLIDIDASDISEGERMQYNLLVPLIFLGTIENYQMAELPRVSPRMNKEGLFQWLKKVISNKLAGR